MKRTNEKAGLRTKKGGVIGFRADPIALAELKDLAKTLKVDKSVLARNAYFRGLIEVVSDMKKERVQSAEAEQQRLSALVPQALYAFKNTSSVLRKCSVDAMPANV